MNSKVLQFTSSIHFFFAYAAEALLSFFAKNAVPLISFAHFRFGALGFFVGLLLECFTLNGDVITFSSVAAATFLYLATT